MVTTVLEAILALTSAVDRASTLEEIYDAALDAIQRGLAVRRASILLFDADGVMRFKAARGLSLEYRGAVEGHSPWTPSTTDAAPIVVNDVTVDARLEPFLPVIRAEGIAAMAFVPLMSGGVVTGKFMLYYERPYTPAAEELHAAMVIAAQVSFALGRARAEHAAREEEQARRASEQYLRTVIEATPECVKVVARDGTLVEMNPAGLQMVEADSRDELIGHCVYDLIAPEHREEYRRFNERICDGACDALEFDVIGLRGTRRHMETRAVPVQGPDRTTMHLALTRDVTTRRKAEQALRDSEAMFRQLADTLPQIIWVTDNRGVPHYFNSRWYEFTGLAPGTFDQDAWRARIHRDDRQSSLDAWQRAMAAGAPYESELRLQNGVTGEYRWHLARALPVRDKDGLIVRWVGSSTDIDERKRAEAASRFLAEASRALSTLVDYQTALGQVAQLAVPDFADWCAVDVLEDDGRLHRLALAHADASTSPLAVALHERYPGSADAPHGPYRVIRTGEPEMLSDITDAMLVENAQEKEQLRMLRALELRSSITVPLRAGAAIIGTMTFATSGTSGRRYTEQDMAMARELTFRAGIAIENARLYTELQETDRQKDEFLAMLAHELRNPLAPMWTALQLIERAGGDPARRERACSVIDRQLRQLVRLVDDLLDLSRVTRGKIVLQRQPVELATIIQNAVETVRPMIEAAGHALTVSDTMTGMAVDGDPTRLAQVFSNLLNNAAKYTNRGGDIRLTVEGEPDSVVVRITDNGKGIPRDMLARIFDPFTQVDGSLEKVQGGLGIGLTLVKRLVEMHGGVVDAYSDGPNAGSEFIVRLPRCEISAVRPRTDAVASMPPPGAALRIVVADDNVDAAECLAEALRLSGHHVVAVHDGLTAVEQARALRPDAILLDLGMPRMNGYAAAQMIRREFGTGVQLIAVTGWGQSDDRRRSREAGFDHHLVKPVDPEKLIAVLQVRNGYGTPT